MRWEGIEGNRQLQVDGSASALEVFATWADPNEKAWPEPNGGASSASLGACARNRLFGAGGAMPFCSEDVLGSILSGFEDLNDTNHTCRDVFGMSSYHSEEVSLLISCRCIVASLCFSTGTPTFQYFSTHLFDL